MWMFREYSSMKRPREDSSFGPPLKRSASASGESSEPVQPAVGSQGVTTDNALHYLQAVKDRFKDDKDKYDEFLEVMKHFKGQRIDTAGVISRVKELFRSHPQLIIGFNTFLPKGYEITLSLDEEPPPPKKQPVEFDQAINYVNKIKMRFEREEPVYKAFLEILNMYRKGNKSISDVYQEVASLFQNHSDLLEEFTYFLPDSTGTMNVPGPVSCAKLSSINKRDDKSTLMVPAKHPSSIKTVKRERETVGADPGVHDRGSEHPGKRQIDCRALKAEMEYLRKVEKEAERKYKWEHKEAIKGEKESERENDLETTQRRSHKCKSAQRADEMICEQAHGGVGGETFAGPSDASPLPEGKSFGKSTSIQKEFAFFEKVKGKLRNRESYQELLKCLNLYNEKIIIRSELQYLVEDILGKHQELLEEFNKFLSQRGSIGGYLADIFGKTCKGIVESEGAVLVDKDKEREKERNRERDHDKDKQRERERRREKEKDKEREKEREKENERERVFSHHAEDGASHKIYLLPPKEKFMNKPISELDLSNCERCTPSYRLLPKNYPKPSLSHRVESEVQVLNDNWVSVTSGSEDYSFKHMRKNQYEESLFCCEDDRFELDMLLESTAITAKHVGEMVDNIHDLTKPESQFSPDEHLSAINIRCIEKIYGDHGLDMMDLLRKSPVVALPIVHARLKQKHEEWLKCRMDMNKVWAEVYSKNYHKSLDHRSFYFKQQDKKNLSTKGLLTEIKEINEKKRREDDTTMPIAVGNCRALIPDMRFEYSDPTMHEELYQIIKYSAYKICHSMEQSDKMIRIWTNFIEPMLGVPPRVPGAEDMEEAAEVKASEFKQSDSSAGQSTTSGGAGGKSKTANQLVDALEYRNTASAIVDELTTASSRVKVERIDAPASLPDTSEAVTTTAALHLREDEGLDFHRAYKGNLKMDSLKSRVPFSHHSEKAESRKQHDHCERAIDTKIKQSLGTEAASSRSSSDCMENNESKGKLMEGCQDLSTCRMANDVGHEAKPRDQGLPPGDTGEKQNARGDGDKQLGYQEEIFASNCSTFNARLGRIEREEGELSPSLEVEERENMDLFHDKCTPEVADSFLGKVLKDCKSIKELGATHRNDEKPDVNGGCGGNHDADADDECGENAQKTEDSENFSEVGEEISGSVSGNNDDASHEFREEEDDEDEDQEGKVESEGEAEDMADVQDGEGNNFLMPSSDHSLVLCRPLAVHAASLDIGPPSNDNVIFYGNDMFYILFRLHQCLYERILSAKTNSIAAERKRKIVQDISTPELYTKVMTALYNLLDGSVDNTNFEDECRSAIGTQSYNLFTLDKLIYKLVKQLQAIAADDVANRLLLLHTHEKSRVAGGIFDIAYHANACVFLHDESIFRFEHKKYPSELSIQLMEGGPEKLEVPATAIDYPFQKYLNNYLLSVSERKDRHRVFSDRNKRRFLYDEECEASIKVMKNVYVVNGLECKIACSTSKVSYVLDTEDLLHRRKRSKLMHGQQDRVQRFLKWLEHKQKGV